MHTLQQGFAGPIHERNASQIDDNGLWLSQSAFKTPLQFLHRGTAELSFELANLGAGIIGDGDA
jgi:hypothetical protein